MRAFAFAAGVFGVVIGIITESSAAEKLIATKDNLQAFMEEGVCTPALDITVRAPDKSAFAGDKVALQMLLGGVQTIVGFQCQAANIFNITGEVGGAKIYAGKIDKSAGGVLVDLPGTPTATTTTAQTSTESQTVEAPGAAAIAAPGAATIDAPGGATIETSDAASTQEVQEAEASPTPPAVAPITTDGTTIDFKKSYGVPSVFGRPAFGATYSSLFSDDEKSAQRRFADYMNLSTGKKIGDSFSGSMSDSANCFAINHLPDEATKLKYLTRANQWKGDNEFEQGRTKESFLTEQAPSLQALAPKFPLEIVNVSRLSLGKYDKSLGGYNLFQPHAADNYIVPQFSPHCAGQMQVLRPAATFDTLVKLSEAEAEALVNRLVSTGGSSSGQFLYLVSTLRISPLSAALQNYGTQFTSEALSIDVYEDPDFKKKLATLPIYRSLSPLFEAADFDNAVFGTSARLDDENYALMLLRANGDILTGESWQRLLSIQFQRDRLHYEAAMAPNHTKSEDAAPPTFAQDYQPFFPYGFSQQLATRSEETLKKYKSYVLKKSETLPEKMLLTVNVNRDYQTKIGKIGWPSVSKASEGTAAGALQKEGLSVGQILNGTGSQTIATEGSRNESVIVLPNVATAYAETLTNEETTALFGEQNMGSIPIEIELAISKTRLVPIAEGRAAFVIDGAPKRLIARKRDTKEVLFERGFEVAAIDPNQSVADSLAVTPPSPSLKATAEAMDLIQAKFLPSSLTDDDYARIYRARWFYEKSLSDRKMTPDWGRFFVEGKPQPTDEAMVQDLPKLKKWVTDRAAAISGDMTIVYRTARPNQEGRFDTGVHSISASGAEISSGLPLTISNCAREAESKPLMKPACDYLDHVRENLSLIYPFGSGHKATGPRLACNSAVAMTREYYCMGARETFPEDTRGQAEAGFRDILVIDKEVYPPSDQPDFQLGSSGTYHMELDVQVTGVSVVEGPVEDRMQLALKKYATYLEANGLGGSGYRFSEEAPAPLDYLRFDAQVKDARIVDAKTGNLISKLELRDARIPNLDSLDTTGPKLEDLVPKAPYGLDVVGLKLGMTMEQAEQAVRSHMTVGQVLVQDRANAMEAITGGFRKFSSNKVFISDDYNEMIILYDEPPAAKGVVVGITRQMRFPEGQATASGVMTQLKQKYGAPDWVSSGGDAAWGKGAKIAQRPGSSQHMCAASSSNSGLRDYRMENGAEIVTSGANALTQFVPTLKRMNSYQNAVGVDCGSVLSMKFENNQLILQLGDMSRYKQLFDESKSMIESGAGGFGSNDAPKVDIKL